VIDPEKYVQGGFVKATPYQAPLDRALKHTLSHLAGIDDAPVAATASISELRAGLGRPLDETGIDAAQVIDELVAGCAGGILGSTGGRFFGWVIGAATPAALAADWLTSAWDQNAASVATGPAEAVIEEICGAWLKDLLGLPTTASFALVSGSQMRHVTCLAAARNALLGRSGWDVERDGLVAASPIRIVSSDQRHGSIERAARLLGLGSASIIGLPTDKEGRLRPDVLDAALRRDPDVATIVVLQAGDLNIGAFDPFEELIPLAHASGAWVHVDGAFGLWVAASPQYRSYLAGVERANSWVTDGHKWLNVPYDSGYAFVADPSPHHAAFGHRASYIVRAADARDPSEWTPEWSRRGRGVATYAALRELGRRGVAELIERTCRHAYTLATRIDALPGAELVCEPRINQGLVRFLDSRSGATERDHDRRTDEIMERILGTGEAFFSGSTWRGKRCMRISVCSWRTDDADVDRTIAAVRHVLQT
jgi:glutamate/tyrosine decarboxylase-like PLP-dependent enzyme